MRERTPRDVINGRYVRLTEEHGFVGKILAHADRVFDRLIDDPPATAEDRWLLRGEGRGLVRALVEISQGEYDGEQVRWMLEHRRQARVGGDTG